MAIEVYCVGIFFDEKITFKADSGTFMSGEAVLAACASQFHLRYQLTVKGSISYLSFTPVRVPTKHTGPTKRIFPFIGQPLKLIQKLRPVGEISEVFQYNLMSGSVKHSLEGRPNFKGNGFSDGSEIRIRLLSIYDPVGLDDLIT